MSSDRPNHFRYQNGETIVGSTFGPVAHVTPIHFAGSSSTPHLEVRFTHGLRLDLTPQSFVELLREGQEALAKLPFQSPPDCSGAVWAGGEQ